MAEHIDRNQIVSVKQMAAMLNMSRSRLYQLIHESVLLPPVYDIATKRPFFTAELIERNLEAKRRNCGINGKAMLFYSPRHGAGRPPKPTQKRGSRSKHSDLIDGLKALGMKASNTDVDAALQELFPNDQGVSVDDGERLRAVYRLLRCRNHVHNCEHNVGA